MTNEQTTMEEETIESQKDNEEQKTETKIDASDSVAEKIIAKIDEKISARKDEGTTVTPEQRREMIKQKTGYTDDQIDLIEKEAEARVAARVAPLEEKLAWAELRQELGSIDPVVEKEMKEYLNRYPPHMRGDKVLIENVHDMILGRKSRTSSKQKTTVEEPTRDDRVVERRIMQNTHQASTTGLSSSSSSKGSKLTDDEKWAADKYGMTDEEYAKHKSSRNIESEQRLREKREPVKWR